MNQETLLDDSLATLSPGLLALYHEARDAYLRGDHEQALKFDERLYEQARQENNPLGKILGRRFMGLCCYRLGRLDDSADHFRTAHHFALEAKDLPQQLLIANHLASTVRRQGKLDEAYHLLTNALEQAALPRCVHAHARLVGNLGALLDELGQRRRADDCYARFEVLAEILGNQHRLANARGLAARAAELRGELDTAEKKYREERDLAALVRDPLRQIAATLHTARMTALRKKNAEAEALFKEALQQTEKCSYEKRRIDALEAYAEFLHKRGDFARAYYYFEQAAGRSHGEPEKKALVAHKRALLCGEAGLLGESLYYLMRSVETRHEIYKKLKRHVSDLARARMEELEGITDKLVEEAFRVDRSGAEIEDLEELVVRVRGDDKWKGYEAKLKAITGPPVWNWRTRAEEAARSTWKKRLPERVFKAFDETTQKALIRAEMSYGNTIDDLVRSAQLMLLAVECELRKRIFEPARQYLRPSAARDPASKTHKYFTEHVRWTLGNMLECLEEVVSAAPPPSKDDLLLPLRQFLDRSKPQLKHVKRLTRPISPLKGKQFKLLDIRNGIAHDLSIDLNRLQVDAITRTLTLEIRGDGDSDVSIMEALSQIHL